MRPADEDVAQLVNNTRLSVQPVSAEEWEIICRLGGVEP